MNDVYDIEIEGADSKNLVEESVIKCGEIYRGLGNGSLTFSCLHCNVKYTQLSEYARHLEDIYQLIDLSTTEAAEEESYDDDNNVYHVDKIDENLSSNFQIKYEASDDNIDVKDDISEAEYLDLEYVDEYEDENHTNVEDANGGVSKLREGVHYYALDAENKRMKKELFNCKYCHAKFDMHYKQLKHTVTDHWAETIEWNTKFKKEVCHMCGVTFDNFKRFRHHMLQFHNIDYTACHICKENVKITDFLSHRRQHEETDCNVCKKKVPKANLQTHLKTHSEYQCSVCGEVLKSYHRIIYHMKVKHPENGKYVGFTCSFCGKSFADSFSLQSHEFMHQNHRPFVCDVCHTDFTTKFFLQIHMRLHSGERPYKCDQCDKGFRTSSHRIRHVRMEHTKDIKKYKCSLCDKRFEYPLRLKHHMISHTGERPFKCEHCEKSYAHPKFLSRHRNDSHPEATRPFSCKHCKKRFLNTSNLNKHEHLVHGDRDGMDGEELVVT